MARAAKPKKEISMEEALWKSADKLRGSVEPAEYKHVVLSLFFLKFASDKFEECRNKIIATHGEKYADMIRQSWLLCLMKSIVSIQMIKRTTL